MVDELPPDFQRLIDEMAASARSMLETRGAFLPFGSGLTESGATESETAALEGGHEEEEQLVDHLLERFRALAAEGRLRSVGVCVHVQVTPPQREPVDAVLVFLENLQGQALNVYLPYQQHGDGRVSYSEMLIAPGEPKIFTGPLPVVN